jgi:hypothetical protein
MHVRTQLKAGYTLQDAADTTCKAAHQTSGYLTKAQQQAAAFVGGVRSTTKSVADTLVSTFNLG